MNIPTAQGYYNSVRKAKFISDFGNIIDDFKLLYPNSPLLDDAVEYSTIKVLEYARKQHNGGKYGNAMMYYDQILNEELTNNSVKQAVSVHKQQAVDKVPLNII